MALVELVVEIHNRRLHVLIEYLVVPQATFVLVLELLKLRLERLVLLELGLQLLELLLELNILLVLVDQLTLGLFEVFDDLALFALLLCELVLERL